MRFYEECVRIAKSVGAVMDEQRRRQFAKTPVEDWYQPLDLSSVATQGLLARGTDRIGIPFRRGNVPLFGRIFTDVLEIGVCRYAMIGT